MKQNTFTSGRALCRLSLVAVALASLSACTHQSKLQQQKNQAELAVSQQCIAQQQTQNEQLNRQQEQILTQLLQVQTQLAAQQKTLETQPRVIERQAPKVVCPPVDAARKNATKEQPLTDKQIVGLREQTLIAGLNVVMNARISTNVAYSVIDARNIQMFERNSEEWVRFTIYNPETKEPHVLERKRLRFQSVQATANPTPDRRPVVEIRFTIGKLTQRGEFILADRSTSEFPILIGRNLLRDVMLVDVSGNNLAPLQRSDASSSASSAAAKN